MVGVNLHVQPLLLPSPFQMLWLPQPLADRGRFPSPCSGRSPGSGEDGQPEAGLAFLMPLRISQAGFWRGIFLLALRAGMPGKAGPDRAVLLTGASGERYGLERKKKLWVDPVKAVLRSDLHHCPASGWTLRLPGLCRREDPRKMRCPAGKICAGVPGKDASSAGKGLAFPGVVVYPHCSG